MILKRLAGFSLLEVMIASVVVAVAALSLIGYHGHLQQLRQQSAQMNRLNAIGRSIIDQIVTRDSATLGVNSSSTLKWARPRFMPISGLPTGTNYNPPLTEGASNPDNDLLATGLITEPTGIPNLQVYIEYYFGASSGATGGVNGIFDDHNFNSTIVNVNGKLDVTSPDKFRSAMSNPTFLAQYRIDPANAPQNQVSSNDNLLIRVVLVWGDGQQMDFYTAKRKEP
jgi:prepilin-type N-terminal cleavage/methylation domain-containing protein